MVFSNFRPIDTESTSNNPEDAWIVELASGYYHEEGWHCDSEMFKPVEQIPFEAMAVNNITNRMVSKCLPLAQNLERVEQLLDHDEQTIFLAHNADYDRSLLKKELTGLIDPKKVAYISDPRNWCCTWRLSKHVLGNEYEGGQYNLNYLRYYLDVDVTGQFHRATTDVEICAKVFEQLFVIGAEKELIYPDSKNLKQDLYDLCNSPVLMKKFPFGKHRGVLFSEIPNDYYLWALNNLKELQENNPQFNKDLAFSIAHTIENR